MKHNKLLALALLSSLALVACGENKENNSSNNDNQGEIVNPSTDSNNSSDNGSTDNGSGDNGSSDNGDEGGNEGGNTELPGGENLPSVPEIPEANVTVDLKQEFFDKLKGAAVSEVSRRGDFNVTLDGSMNIKHLRTTDNDGNFVDIPAETLYPDTNSSVLLNATRDESENTFDGYTALKSDDGYFKSDEKAYKKLWKQDGKYLSYDKLYRNEVIEDEVIDNINNITFYQASEDEIYSEFLNPMEDSVKSIVAMPELESFAQIEEMVTQMISSVKEGYNYEIVPTLKLSKDNENYKIDLTVKGTGKIELFTYQQGVNGEVNNAPFDTIKNVEANVQLYYTASSINYGYVSVKGNVISGFEAYDENDVREYVQEDNEITASGYFKLSHETNSAYVITPEEDKDNTIANAPKKVSSVNIDFVDSKPQFGMGQEVYCDAYYNGKAQEEKVDISALKTPHSHIKLYNGLREIKEEDLKFKSYYQYLEANLTVDDGYALLVCSDPSLGSNPKLVEVEIASLENGVYTLDMKEHAHAIEVKINHKPYPTTDPDTGNPIPVKFNVESGTIYYLSFVSKY